jgi:hypothetical protein
MRARAKKTEAELPEEEAEETKTAKGVFGRERSDKFLFSGIDHRFVCRQNLGSLRRGELRSPEKLKNIDFIYFNHTQ